MSGLNARLLWAALIGVGWAFLVMPEPPFVEDMGETAVAESSDESSREPIDDNSSEPSTTPEPTSPAAAAIASDQNGNDEAADGAALSETPAQADGAGDALPASVGGDVDLGDTSADPSLGAVADLDIDDADAVDYSEIAPEAVEAVYCSGPPQDRASRPYSSLTTNQAVVDLIKSHEGLRLEAYTGPSGKLLIGYGHGGDSVTEGMVIDQAKAEAFLKEDLRSREELLKQLLTAPVTENEFSAMIAMIYNVGITNFRNSTLLAKFNEGDREGAAEEFLKWNKVNGEENTHLTSRRIIERDIFLCESEASYVGE